MSDGALEQVNRFIIIVAAMLIIFALAIVVLIAWAAPSDGIGWVDDFAGYLADHETREAKTIVTLVAVVISLLMLTLIIVQLTPSPTEKMRVRDVKAGDATIKTTEIAGRIDDGVREVAHVADCRSIVAARGTAVEVVLDLHVDAGADLAKTADEACRRAHEIVEQEIGVRVSAPPRATLHYRELLLKEEPARPGRTTQLPSGWERPADEGTHDER
ncbi:MAG: hypothetical protein WD359_08340, partial [Dehalococcoidia bacterium]